MTNHDSHFYDDYTYYFHKEVIITGMSMATISTLSSLLILSIIYRSRTKLKTVYHRIMTTLSTSDLILSIPLVFSTLALPKTQSFPFELPSYGNDTTCQLQGIAIIIGYQLIGWFSILLNIFHLCILKFEMQEMKFRKWIEIPFYVLGVPIFCILPILTAWGNFQATPLPWCAGKFEDANEKSKKDVRFITFIGISFGLLFLCMGLILKSFYTKKRNIQKEIRRVSVSLIDQEEEMSQDQQELIQDAIREKKEILLHCQENSRKVTIQAVMYILAFTLVIMFGFIEWFLNRGYIHSSHSSRQAVAVLRMIFQPLQGFFNMMIFVHQKVLTAQINDADLTYAEALWIVVFYPGILDHDEGPKISNLELLLGNGSFSTLRFGRQVEQETSEIGDVDNDDDEQERRAVSFDVDEDVDQASTGNSYDGQLSQQLSAFTRLVADEDEGDVELGDALIETTTSSDIDMNLNTIQNEGVNTTEPLTPSTTSRLEHPIDDFENNDDLSLTEKMQFIPDELCDNDDVSTVCR
ncbi:hypothetical protein CTEN210_09166 [Chaetoceros tenuissimus]|uniref:G-protein coupled receptors family 1 profile domain-containing protein n=1 Tax=Chaetoceros tenuissimus TaxID=426638 RepID=A0AAD3CXD2_9STRA|nr:hypothetical protein CTEN210_09166 [Chaetoceros tenuissimus]